MNWNHVQATTEATVLGFISITAIVGNGSLFLIIYKDKRLLTVTNFFVLSQAAADIMVSMFSMPITAITIIHGRWVFGHSACVAIGFITILSLIASVMSLGMIAVNRYFYIVRWKTYSKTFSRKRGILYAAGIWTLSFALSFPPIFGWAEYRYIPGKSYCFVYWPSDVYFMYFMIVTCFFGPLSAMVFSYYNILSFTKKAKRQLFMSRNSVPVPRTSNYTAPIEEREMPQEMQTRMTNIIAATAITNELNYLEAQTHQTVEASSDINKIAVHPKQKASKVTAEEVKITNTFLLVVALFLICWSPFAITMFFDVYYPRPLPRAIDVISLLLGYLNSMCNPIVYGMRHSAFRKVLRDQYSKRLPRCFRASSVDPSAL